MISRRTSVVSIPTIDDQLAIDASLKVVEKVLSTQGKAVSHLASQFRLSEWSRAQFSKSISVLNDSLNQGGKIIVCGMGKSYKIAAKSVATLNSLAVHSALLHPSEALHGDLGIVREDHGDALILISASGNSPEMLTLMRHLPASVPVVLLTCSKRSSLSEHRQVRSLLYAELPKQLSEQSVYGLSAPTISTTLCLSLMDGVSIALAELQVKDLEMRKQLFGVRHPGGAIGQDFMNSQFNSTASTVSSTSLNQAPFSDDASSASEVGAVSETDPESVGSLLDLALVEKLKDSTVAKKSIDKIPETEAELLQLVVLYDLLVVDKKYVIETSEIREIIRSSSDANRMAEYTWRIQQSLRACYI